jgi:hypothetical protein
MLHGGGRGGGGAEPDMPAEANIPLPVEAEEASAQLKYGQLLSLVIGIVFLLLLAWMAYVAATTKGFPYLVPALAMAFFAVGGVVDISLAATCRSGALHLWHQSKFADSDKFLTGWRMTLGFVPGGVLPGWFIYRARERVQPLVQLERGGVPAGPPGGMGGPGPATGGYPAAPAPSGAAPPMGGNLYADSVAPDPFGGRRGGNLPPPSASPMPTSSASVWTRPNTVASASSPPPAGPGVARICPACQTPLDADSRFCKKCGTAVP